MTRREVRSAAVRVSGDVHAGLDSVQASGLTNMLARAAVAQIAAALGYAICACWLRENPDLYERGVFSGFEADDGRKEGP